MNESNLLFQVLCYEEGHIRRTQHILKVYALVKMMGELKGLSLEQRQILQAASILHDIGIKYCKENFDGDASISRQKEVACTLVSNFLLSSQYPRDYIPETTKLVEEHHNYGSKNNTLLQILIEADLLINYFEENTNLEYVNFMQSFFQTNTGKELLNKCLNYSN